MHRWIDPGRAVLCGGATACWLFWLAPGMLDISLADWLLYPALFLAAALVGWAILGGRKPVRPRYLWLSLLTQYGLVWVFRRPFAHALGISLKGLGGFEYLLPAAVWPLAATGAHLAALWLTKCWKDR